MERNRNSITNATHTREIVIRNIAPVNEAVLSAEQRRARAAWPQGRFVVETVGLVDGLDVLENELDASLIGRTLVRRVVAAERDGCDAVTIDCSVDPCLEACRSVVRIPVVGMGQAALLTAALIGRKIGVVTVLPSTAAYIERNAAKYGLGTLLKECAAIEVPCAKLREDPDRTTRALSEACMTLQSNGCDTIVLGCTGLEPLLRTRNIAIPVVFPSACGIELAYLLARLGISHSARAYPPVWDRNLG